MSDYNNSGEQAASAPKRQKSQQVDEDYGDDDDNKERRKIEIKFIADKGRRHITFSKRKAGIMKKAYELSVLTGTQVLLLVVSETGLVYTFTTPKLQPLVTKSEGKNLIQQCLNAPDDAGDGEDGEEDGSGEDDKQQQQQHHHAQQQPQHDMTSSHNHPQHQQQPPLHPHQMQQPYGDPRGPMPGPQYHPAGPPQHRGGMPQMVAGSMQAPGPYGQPYHQSLMSGDQYGDHNYMQHQ